MNITPKKGDRVKLLPKNWLGDVGTVKWVDGQYVYVTVHDPIREVELYPNELEQISEEEYFLHRI